ERVPLGDERRVRSVPVHARRRSEHEQAARNVVDWAMAWPRVLWALGGVAASVGLAAACGYPDFTYLPPSGTDGPTTSSNTTTGPGGGQGGATTSSRTASIASISSSSSTSSAGGGGGGGAGPVSQVPCIDGTMCDPGKICCFGYFGPDCDECIEIAGACGS